MMIIFIAFCCTIILIILVTVEVRRLQLSYRFRHIPGPKEWPLIGSSFTLKPTKIQDISFVLEEACPAPVSKVFFGFSLIFLVSCPNALQKILSTNAFSERPFIFDFFQLKYGIITSKFHIWKPTRKALSSAFSTKSVQSFVPNFVKHFEKTCDEISKHIGKQQPFNVNSIVIETIVGIISETKFGMPDTDKKVIAHTLEKLEENICKRILNVYLHPDAIFQFSKLHHENRKNFDMMKDIFREAMIERKRVLLKSPDTKPIFLDLLVKYYKEEGFDDEDVIFDNATITFGAGYETASLTIAYTILMLAMYPDIDRKVEKEIRENLSHDEEITQDNMKRFPYIDMVIRESLRLFPPAPLSIREANEDVEIDNVGTLKKGSIAVFNFYKLHRWKEFWGEHADEFNPENFSPENIANRHPYAFLPFSAGPRMCLGYQYAMVNIKIGLITILRKFKFTTDLKMQDLKFMWSVTLKLQNQHLVKVYPR